MPEQTLQRMEAQARFLSWVTIAAVIFVMAVALFMMGLTMWNTYRLGQQSTELRTVAVETRDALCAFKRNLVLAQRDARKFVEDNPKGIPGITRETIDQSIANRQNTLDSLQVLTCDGEVIK